MIQTIEERTPEHWLRFFGWLIIRQIYSWKNIFLMVRKCINKIRLHNWNYNSFYITFFLWQWCELRFLVDNDMIALNLICICFWGFACLFLEISFRTSWLEEIAISVVSITFFTWKKKEKKMHSTIFLPNKQLAGTRLHAACLEATYSMLSHIHIMLGSY